MALYEQPQTAEATQEREFCQTEAKPQRDPKYQSVFSPLTDAEIQKVACAHPANPNLLTSVGRQAAIMQSQELLHQDQDKLGLDDALKESQQTGYFAKNLPVSFAATQETNYEK